MRRREHENHFHYLSRIQPAQRYNFKQLHDPTGDFRLLKACQVRLLKGFEKLRSGAFLTS